MSDTADHPFIPARVDARALQLRLYREIGLAAVAAALEPQATPDHAELLAGPTPAIVGEDARAA